MTIDKEKLISLLIHKTGLETEQVENQLGELINRIQKAANEGKTFEIEGFGVFSMEEGNLQFTPNDTLETEINNKYAGMKPIELIGAFKEPNGDDVPEVPEKMPDEIPEEGRWSFDESAVEGKEETTEPVESAETAKPADESGEEELQQPAASKEANDAFEKIFGPLEKAEPAGTVKLDTANETESGLEADEGMADLEEEITESEIQDEVEKDTLGRFLVTAVVVIALGVGGWLIYDLGFFAGNEGPQMSEQSTSQVPAQQTGDRQQETSQNSPSPKNGDNKNSEPEQKMTVINSKRSPEKKEAQPQSKFGLRGAVNQSVEGYTIVVHSLRSMQKAENNRQILEDAGYRALTSQAEVSGTTYYRVGIGQFQTINDAQQAMSELPERYREDNFIKRIK